MPANAHPEHLARIERIQATLGGAGLDGALLVHASDVFYFAGTRQNAALWIPGDGPPILLVRKSLERAREDSSLADARPFPPSAELAEVLRPARRVGFTFDVVPVSVHQLYARMLPGIELVDVAGTVRTQRSVKSPAEIERIRATGRMMCDAYREIPSFLRAGRTELELAAELEYRLRKAGNEGSPRLRGFNQELCSGLVVSAATATFPGCFDGPVTGRGLSAASPVGASWARVERNAPVLFDYTAMKDGYVADMTRVAVCGALAPELTRAFAVALSIQEEVARSLRPGNVPSAIWGRALELADAAGLADRFMGPPGAQARFVGHGVGLELDEWPVLAPGFDAPLVEGQTLAVEPKFVLPGLGAIGIENAWAVSPDGGVRLTELDDAVMVVT
jgi:Xaa-Pro aminopeptidase